MARELKLAQDESMIEIGKLAAAVGLKGEVRVMLYAEESHNLVPGKKIWWQSGELRQSHEVVNVRTQKGRPVVRFSDVADRTAAEALNGTLIYIAEEDLEELPEGEFYVRDLIGMPVYDEASETVIGTIDDYIDATSQAVWRVLSPEGKEILIPDVDAFVKDIEFGETEDGETDAESGRMTVELIPGFLD